MTPIKDAYINSWTALIALFGSVFAMWGLNLAGGQLLVIPFALVGFFVIGFVGFAPKQLAHSAILSGFAAFLSEGGLTRVNIGNELGKGLALHYRIVLVSAYSYTLAAFTLMTWSFANAPSAFWIIFLAVLLLLMAQQLHGTSSAWLPKVVSTYAVACILISLWSTFGGAYSGQAFDALSGEPAYMVDPITGTIDSLNRMPRDCRPTGTAHSNFNYGVDGTCFSAATGQRLVPITSDQALQRNPTSWGGMILKKAGVRSWWIIAGVGIIVALALIALGGPNHP